MRLTAGGRAFEAEANETMLRALMSWVATKPAGRRLGEPALAALAMTVFGGWLFYLTKRAQGVHLDVIERDMMLSGWAARNARMLDNE